MAQISKIDTKAADTDAGSSKSTLNTAEKIPNRGKQGVTVRGYIVGCQQSSADVDSKQNDDKVGEDDEPEQRAYDELVKKHRKKVTPVEDEELERAIKSTVGEKRFDQLKNAADVYITARGRRTNATSYAPESPNSGNVSNNAPSTSAANVSAKPKSKRGRKKKVSTNYVILNSLRWFEKLTLGRRYIEDQDDALNRYD